MANKKALVISRNVMLFAGIALVVILGSVSIFAVRSHNKYIETLADLNNLQKALRKSENDLTALQNESKDLGAQLKVAKERYPSFWQISEDRINKLRKKGLENPREELAVDLMNHAELIPYKGILGGTMGVFSKDHIYFLNNGWVIAYFEDGHYGGYMLLTYQVSDTGDISWKILYTEAH